MGPDACLAEIIMERCKTPQIAPHDVDRHDRDTIRSLHYAMIDREVRERCENIPDIIPLPEGSILRAMTLQLIHEGLARHEEDTCIPDVSCSNVLIGFFKSRLFMKSPYGGNIRTHLHGSNIPIARMCLRRRDPESNDPITRMLTRPRYDLCETLVITNNMIARKNQGEIVIRRECSHTICNSTESITRGGLGENLGFIDMYTELLDLRHAMEFVIGTRNNDEMFRLGCMECAQDGHLKKRSSTERIECDELLWVKATGKRPKTCAATSGEDDGVRGHGRKKRENVCGRVYIFFARIQVFS